MNSSTEIKLTRQGVRDLSHIKGKSKGRVLPEPPLNAGFCSHPQENIIKVDRQWTKCTACDLTFDITKFPK